MEDFSVTIQFWTNLQLIRRVVHGEKEKKAVLKEIEYRIKHNIHR